MLETILICAALICAVDLLRLQMAHRIWGLKTLAGPPEQRLQRVAIQRRAIFYVLAIAAIFCTGGWLNYL